MNASDPHPMPSTGPADLPLEITVHEAARLMRGDPSPLVLDVRENAERMACQLADDLHIPIGQIQANWQNLPRDQRLLVYCHHGMRSLRVAHFLKTMGFDQVQSIHGGIEAWSVEIDPSVPRY